MRRSLFRRLVCLFLTASTAHVLTPTEATMTNHYPYTGNRHRCGDPHE